MNFFKNIYNNIFYRQKLPIPPHEVEKGIKRLMEDGGVRTKVKGMSGKLKVALMENGSSYVSLSALVEQLNQAI